MKRIPKVSVVIPIFNESAILEVAVAELMARLDELGLNYELILAENGSSDGTREIALRMQTQLPSLCLVSIEGANYGKALAAGIQRASGEFVICDEIDLGDTGFYQTALELLETRGADLVIGSKLIGGARDQRPLFRHLASVAYTGLLKLLLDFPGTDTHGLKALRRETLLPIVQACQVDKDVFASELVVRAYRSSLNVLEIPTNIREKRPPSINLLKRVPNVVGNLAKLTWVIRARPRLSRLKDSVQRPSQDP